MNISGQSSPLKKSNSWRPFYEMSTSIIKGRRFFTSDLLELLSYVDPKSSFPRSWSQKLLGAVLGSGFEVGRIALYFRGFQEFCEKNLLEFDRAPLKVIQQFNSLLLHLFGERAKKIYIHEALARDPPSSDYILQRLMLLRNRERQEEERNKRSTRRKNVPLMPLYEASSDIGSEESIQSEELSRKRTQSLVNYPFLKNLLVQRQLSSDEASTVDKALHLIEKYEQIISLNHVRAENDLKAQYPDLYSKLKTYQIPEEPFQCSLDLLESVVSKKFQEIVDGQESCFKEAQSRDSLRKDIQILVQGFISSLDALAVYKDLASELTNIRGHFEAQIILKSELEKIAIDSRDLVFEKKKRLLQGILHDFQAQYEELHLKAILIEQQKQSIVTLALCRLHEVWASLVPYPDEKSSFKIIQEDFLFRVKRILYQFDHGEVFLSQFQEVFEALPYDHDYILTRDENSFRAKRLKDIRQEVLSLRSKASCLMYLSQSSSHLFIPIVEALNRLYTKISDPLSLFEGASEMEDISRVFRGLWIEFETEQGFFEEALENLPLRDENTNRFFEEYIDDLSHVIPPEEIFLVLGEGVLKADHQFFQNISLKLMIEILEKIETRYPFAGPFQMFQACNGTTERRNLLEKLYAIEKLRKRLVEFAKGCESFRVHEEVRIDQLLEFFETWGREASFEHIVENRIAFLAYVFEELMLDFGSLDSKALQVKENNAAQALDQEALLFLKELQELGWKKKITLEAYGDSGVFQLRSAFPRIQQLACQIFWQRIEERSISSRYASQLFLFSQLKKWVVRVEVALFFKRHPDLPAWTIPFIPEAKNILCKIEQGYFNLQTKGEIDDLFDVIHQAFSDAPPHEIAAVDAFKRDFNSKTLQKESGSCIFIPGLLNR